MVARPGLRLDCVGARLRRRAAPRWQRLTSLIALQGHPATRPPPLRVKSITASMRRGIACPKPPVQPSLNGLPVELGLKPVVLGGHQVVDGPHQPLVFQSSTTQCWAIRMAGE